MDVTEGRKLSGKTRLEKMSFQMFPERSERGFSNLFAVGSVIDL